MNRAFQFFIIMAIASALAVAALADAGQAPAGEKGWIAAGGPEFLSVKKVEAKEFVSKGFPNGDYTLKGKIGKYPIQMLLRQDNGVISGHYYYGKSEKMLTLSGTAGAEGDFSIVEYPDATFHGFNQLDVASASSGRFDGRVTETGAFEGVWQGGVKNLKLPFELSEKDPAKDPSGFYSLNVKDSQLANGSIEVETIGPRRAKLNVDSANEFAGQTCRAEGVIFDTAEKIWVALDEQGKPAADPAKVFKIHRMGPDTLKILNREYPKELCGARAGLEGTFVRQPMKTNHQVWLEAMNAPPPTAPQDSYLIREQGESIPSYVFGRYHGEYCPDLTVSAGKNGRLHILIAAEGRSAEFETNFYRGLAELVDTVGGERRIFSLDFTQPGLAYGVGDIAGINQISSGGNAWEYDREKPLDSDEKKIYQEVEDGIVGRLAGNYVADQGSLSYSLAISRAGSAWSLELVENKSGLCSLSQTASLDPVKRRLLFSNAKNPDNPGDEECSLMVTFKYPQQLLLEASFACNPLFCGAPKYGRDNLGTLVFFSAGDAVSK